MSARWPCCAPIIAFALMCLGCRQVLGTDGYRVGGARLCAEGEAPDGSGDCVPVGPQECGDGFEAGERGGCKPMLPATRCSDGMYAYPGLTTCETVGSVCPNTANPSQSGTAYADADLFVWAAADPSVEDGSKERPFATVRAALASAVQDDVIVVAPGEYAEDLLIDERVTLQGMCAEGVVLSATAGVVVAATGAVLRDLQVTGRDVGIRVDADDVLLADVWVRDTGAAGVMIEGSATIERSLVERATGRGVVVVGGGLELRKTNVRDVVRRSDRPGSGQGIVVRPERYSPDATSPTEVRLGQARVEQALVENTTWAGIDFEGGVGEVVGTSVRQTGTAPSIFETFGPLGAGIVVRRDVSRGVGPTAESPVLVEQCAIDASHGAAVRISSAHARLVSSTITDTRTIPGTCTGHGVRVVGVAPADASVSIDHSLVTDSQHSGVHVLGGAAEVAFSDIRNTIGARCAGDGVAVYTQPSPAVQMGRATAEVRASRIAASARAGVVGFGAEIRLVGSALVENGADLVAARFSPIDSTRDDKTVFQLDGMATCGSLEEVVSCAATSQDVEVGLQHRDSDGGRTPVISVDGSVAQGLPASAPIDGMAVRLVGYDETPWAISGADGEFTLGGVPGGLTAMIAWRKPGFVTQVVSTQFPVFDLEVPIPLATLPLSTVVTDLEALLGVPLDFETGILFASVQRAGVVPRVRAPDGALIDATIVYEQAGVLRAEADAQGTGVSGHLIIVGLAPAMLDVSFEPFDPTETLSCTPTVPNPSGVPVSEPNSLRIPIVAGAWNRASIDCSE